MQTPSTKSSLNHFAPHVARQVDGPIRVRAIMRGFYNNTLRFPGTEFGIHTMEEFGAWMELLPEGDSDATGHRDEDAIDEDAKPQPKKGGKKKPADDDVL